LCDEIDPTDSSSTNTDGISYSFDLDSQTDLIVDGKVDRDGNPFTVTYHETLTDAQDITKTGLSSPYTNDIKSSRKSIRSSNLFMLDY
jgi:hypothetical protein